MSGVFKPCCRWRSFRSEDRDVEHPCAITLVKKKKTLSYLSPPGAFFPNLDAYLLFEHLQRVLAAVP